MSTYCFPQLLAGRTKHLVARMGQLSAEEARDLSATSDPATVYSPLGGVRVPESKLAAFQDACREKAETLGYPEAPSVFLRRKVDLELTKLVAEHLRMTDFEAAQSGVWDFVSLVLLPDLVVWRFRQKSDQSTSEERFISGRRNTFERLWRRWQFLAYEDGGVDPTILERLDEDELVQITERPRLLGARRLQQIALRMAIEAEGRKQHGRSFIRDLQKRLLRVSSVVSLGAMADEDIKSLVARQILESERALAKLAAGAA